MNHKYKILKYLYKRSSNNHQYKVKDIFNDKVNIEVINRRALELEKEGLIDIVSNTPPVKFTNDPTPRGNNELEIWAKITKKGEEYLEERTISIGKFRVRKNSIWYIILFR